MIFFFWVGNDFFWRRAHVLACNGFRSPFLKAPAVSARFTTSTAQLTGRGVNLAEDNWHPI